MLIREMTQEASIKLLESADVGRIGCARGLQPYVTPLIFAYSEDFIYSFATVGKKVEWMRANPLVCVEADKIVSQQQWQTVVVFGRYQELPKTPDFNDVRQLAHDLLAKRANWWEPGFAKTLKDGSERTLETVFYRISIDEISGHDATLIAVP